VQIASDLLAEKYRSEARHEITKQGYLWIVDRTLMVTERANPVGERKGIVLRLSQSKIPEDGWNNRG
jgi:hypothetical protein